MSRKLAVITEIIAPYRIPVFNALASERDLELKVIFLAENDPQLREWLVYKNEMLFSYQVLSSWRAKLPNGNILLNWGMRALLREYSPDAIICGGYNDPADWNAWLWARRMRVPFLVWVESNVNDHRGGGALFESLKKRFLAGCSGAVVAGKASAAYVQNLGVPEEKISTAPNAVDNDLFAEGAARVRKDAVSQRRTLGLPERYFLFVGRLVREKGIFDLMDAYGCLGTEIREQVGLVFVGDGRDRQELEARARMVSPGRIVFRGFVQRDDLVAEYALADVFIFPTHSDPWGLSVNEAMACGLPVIMTDVAGCARDLLEDSGNGRIVAAAGPAQLSVAMRELACDTELRATMGNRSLEIIANYSPRHCADGLATAARSAWDRNV